jgi:hypothetical protein
MLISHADTIVIDAHRRALIGEAMRNQALELERDGNRTTIALPRHRDWTGRLRGLVVRFTVRMEHAGLA